MIKNLRPKQFRNQFRVSKYQKSLYYDDTTRTGNSNNMEDWIIIQSKITIRQRLKIIRKQTQKEEACIVMTEKMSEKKM